MRKFFSVTSTLITLAIASGAHAAIITNGALESPLRTNDLGMIVAGSGSSALPGWTVTGHVDVVSTQYWNVGQGNFSVDLISSPGLGAISQVLNGLSIGDAYELTFLMAINPGANGEQFATKRMALTLTDSNAALITPNLVSSSSSNITATGGPTSIFSGIATGSYANFPYFIQTVDFVATTTSVTLKFAGLTSLNLPGGKTGSTSYTGPVIDDVNMIDLGAATPPTPEPASLAILGTGAVMLLGRKRKR